MTKHEDTDQQLLKEIDEEEAVIRVEFAQAEAERPDLTEPWSAEGSGTSIPLPIPYQGN